MLPADINSWTVVEDMAFRNSILYVAPELANINFEIKQLQKRKCLEVQFILYI